MFKVMLFLLSLAPVLTTAASIAQLSRVLTVLEDMMAEQSACHRCRCGWHGYQSVTLETLKAGLRSLLYTGVSREDIMRTVYWVLYVSPTTLGEADRPGTNGEERIQDLFNAGGREQSLETTASPIAAPLPLPPPTSQHSTLPVPIGPRPRPTSGTGHQLASESVRRKGFPPTAPGSEMTAEKGYLTSETTREDHHSLTHSREDHHSLTHSREDFTSEGNFQIHNSRTDVKMHSYISTEGHGLLRPTPPLQLVTPPNHSVGTTATPTMGRHGNLAKIPSRIEVSVHSSGAGEPHVTTSVNVQPATGPYNILYQAAVNYADDLLPTDTYNPFEFQLGTSEKCYVIRYLAGKGSDVTHAWFLKIVDHLGKVLYEGECMPSKTQLPMRQGYRMALYYRPRQSQTDTRPES